MYSETVLKIGAIYVRYYMWDQTEVSNEKTNWIKDLLIFDELVEYGFF